jgi:hypothetical protein
LTVGFGDPGTFYTAPFRPADAHIAGVECARADMDAVPPALDGIEEALGRYPVGFVARLAHGIFVCGPMRIGGAEAGGTVGKAWILLAAPLAIGAPSIRLTSLLGVHHELSSLVLARDPSLLPRFGAFAPGRWTYAGGARDSLSRADAADPPPSTGFLSAYGGTTPENDFNVYAEKLFTEPAAVSRLAATSPLIARKAAFVMAAYAAVDPSIDDTFRALGLGALASAP